MAKVFSLEGKGLKIDTAEDVEKYIKPLREMKDVEEVRLLGNTFGVEACRVLGEVLEKKTTLQVVNLADIFTGRLLDEIPQALGFLLRSLAKLSKLHTINLNDNAFGLNTQAPLVVFLSDHVPLRHLILNNNGLGPHAGINIANALTTLALKKREAREAGQDVPNLETVICGRNRLENGSMNAWATMFTAHSGVKEVKMVQNGIRQEGISHLLLEGLNSAKGLEILDLQDNTFTIMGAKALVRVVSGWVELRELGIGDSLLSSKGGGLLGETLEEGKNTKLEVLRLQYNEIDSKGLGKLTKAVKILPSLKRIELNGNKFSEEDQSIMILREILEERKGRSGDLIMEDDWGIDELSDMDDEDEDDEDEDDEDDEDDDVEKQREKLIEEAEEAQEEPVIQVKDEEVDELADELKKASI